MTIAYCLHSLHRPGGIERVLTLKANYLAENGYDIHIITSSLKGRPTAFPLSEKIILHDLGANENLPWSGYGKKLEKVLKTISADIAIAVSGSCMEGLLSCDDRSHKLAEFHFSHEKYLMKYGSNPLGKVYALYRTRKMEALASRFERFVVLTESDRKDWSERLGNVCAIHNPRTFVSSATAPLDERRCIAVGRLEAQKNFSDAICSWQKIARLHPDWTLDIYGNGSLEKALRKQINKLGLDGKVRLMGVSRTIREEMLRSSAMIMTSRFEGFPMALLEAAETGLPMISYDCPKGPSEIIRDGINGYLVRPGDTDGLAEAICRVIEDPQKRKDMGRKAKEGSEAFRTEVIMEKWVSLFREVTGA